MDKAIQFETKVPLQQWIDQHPVSQEMLRRSAACDQMQWARTLAAELGAEVFAVSSHRSKSIELPVYLLEKDEVQIILRDNFHNYSFTVVSPRPVHLPPDLAQIVVLGSGYGMDKPLPPRFPIHRCYCEGFQAAWVLHSYAPGERCFSGHIWSQENMQDLLREVLDSDCENDA